MTGVDFYGPQETALRITCKGKIFYKFLTVFDSDFGYWYKYGLEIEGWTYPKVRVDSGLTYV